MVAYIERKEFEMFWLLGKFIAWLERPVDLSAELRKRESLKKWAEAREREREKQNS